MGDAPSDRPRNQVRFLQRVAVDNVTYSTWVVYALASMWRTKTVKMVVPSGGGTYACVRVAIQVTFSDPCWGWLVFWDQFPRKPLLEAAVFKVTG